MLSSLGRKANKLNFFFIILSYCAFIKINIYHIVLIIHDLFQYTWGFASLAASCSLEDEAIKLCYRLGAKEDNLRELPDLSGLDWREALSRCLESIVVVETTSLEQQFKEILAGKLI